MADTRVVRVRIDGRVQGVFYRGWTEETARAMKLKGWVRNRPDGSVEAVFAGPSNVVRKMLDACAHGPQSADVEEVTIMEEGGEMPPDFRVLPTG